MKIRYQISLVILGVLLCSSILIGTSYSLWTVSSTQTTANTLNSGCFTFTFTEGSNNINLTNSYPISDASGLVKTPYTFTIKNDCTIDANTSISLDTINTSTLSRSYLKVGIKSSSESSPTTGIISTYTAGTVTDSSTMSDAYIIKTDTLTAGSSKSYSIWLWIDESVGNAAQGKNYSAKVVINYTSVS